MTDQPQSPLSPELENLLQHNLPALQAFVRMRAGPAISARESSSDLVQSVCRELLQGVDRFSFHGEDAFRGWLFSTAMHKIQEKVRFHRAQKRDVGREVAAAGHGDDGERSLLDCYATFATPSRDLAIQEQVAALEAAFGQLADEDREIIAMARIAGLPHTAITEQLGILRIPERRT